MSHKENAEAGHREFPCPAFFELHDAVVRRAGKNILSVDDFRLEEGEHLALLGPNGSGKSTFIKLITREFLPLYRDQPPVLFRGKPRATLVEVKKCLGIVSSSMQDEITVHMPVEQIVVGGLYGSLGIPIRVVPTDDDYEKAHEALEMVGIRGLAKRDVMTLSTGQARRVLIARALVSNPSVLVFDEPCTGLDPEGMHYVRKSMRTLAQAGKAIVLVTHYPEDVIPEIGRVAYIKDGLVFDDGPKEKMFTNERLSALFDIPLQVVESGGYYSLLSAY